MQNSIIVYLRTTLMVMLLLARLWWLCYCLVKYWYWWWSWWEGTDHQKPNDQSRSPGKLLQDWKSPKFLKACLMWRHLHYREQGLQWAMTSRWRKPPLWRRDQLFRGLFVLQSFPVMGVAKCNGQTLRITLYDSDCDKYDNGTFDAKP